MEAKLAKSKSGHDKGHIYVIIKEEGEAVYVADGVLKTVERPKRKNKKHIQLIKQLPETVTKLIDPNQNPGNLEIKRALKLYEKSIMKKNENDI